MTDQATTGAGQAQELPAGRLAGFEDDADEPDLGALLSRRVKPQPADTNGGDTSTAEQPQHTDPTGETDSGTSPAAPGQTQDEQATTSRAPHRRHPKTERSHATTTRDRTPRHSEAKNKIRSSSVHIPAALMDKIVAERERSRRSNGQIVIAAIEDAHSKLGELIGQREAAGGDLFQRRTSRVVPAGDGPLTPLNVRLFEVDYEIIDKLVENFGAYSRGHLITAALTHYLSD